MREFASFDPSIGKGTLVTNGVNKDEQLMIYNDSIYRIRLHFNDNSIGIIPALWNKDYIQTNLPLGKITWEVIDSLNIANNPSSLVYGEVYESGEHVASVNASMQRSVVSSIPGGVSTSVVSLESTGANLSADGTNIITISDSKGNTFVLDNNGIGTWQILVGAVLVQLLKTANVDPLLTLGALNHIVEILGGLTVDQDLIITGSIKNNTIRDNTNGNIALDLSAGTGAVTFPKPVTLSDIFNLPNGTNIDAKTNVTECDYTVPGTSKHTFEVGGGVRILDIKSTGIGLYSGKNIGLVAGSISAIATGTVSIGASSAVVVNHGMAGISAALLTTNQSLSSGTNSAYGYTSTQFTAYNGAAATLVYRWFAYNA